MIVRKYLFDRSVYKRKFSLFMGENIFQIGFIFESSTFYSRYFFHNLMFGINVDQLLVNLMVHKKTTLPHNYREVSFFVVKSWVKVLSIKLEIRIELARFVNLALISTTTSFRLSTHNVMKPKP